MHHGLLGGKDQTTAFCYNSVVQAWARAGNPDRGAHWLSTGLAEGMQMTAVSFNGVIDAYAKEKNSTEAEHWKRSLVDAGVSLAAPRSARPPRSSNAATGQSGARGRGRDHALLRGTS